MNWGPQVRKGNGRGPTECQQRLADLLGWQMEVVVPTRIPRGNGYPTCYKIDVGDAELKVAIEVDGQSHCALERKAQDAKKEQFLSRLGWLVLRFTNDQVRTDLDGCVQKIVSTIWRSTGTTTTSPTGC
jgi:hypothetical protein